MAKPEDTPATAEVGPTQTFEHIEDVEESSGESAEASKPDPLTKLQSELEEERKAREKMETRYKDLSSRLTRAQQENAEITKLLKTRILKGDFEDKKSFEDRWAENPQQAVQSEIKSMTADDDQAAKIRQAQMDFQLLMIEHPKWAKYREAVIELSQQPDLAHLSYTREGIRSLFIRAEHEDLLAQLKSKEEPRERAFTEPATPARPATSKTKAPTVEQRRIAQAMGLPIEEYMRYAGD